MANAKIANTADETEMGSSVITAGEYYTAYGEIKDALSAVVGYFTIVYDEGLGVNVMTVSTVSVPPVVYPKPGTYQIASVPGTTRIADSIPVPWYHSGLLQDYDPGAGTSLTYVAYGRYVGTPNDISSASYLGIVATVIGEYDDEFSTHVDEKHLGFVVLESTDGGETWTGTATPESEASADVSDASAAFDLDTGDLTLSLIWDGSDLPPARTKLKIYFVEEWNLDIDYDPGVPNAWDDMVTRTSDIEKTAFDHTFKIVPTMFLATERPILSDFQFDAQPPNLYVNTKQWVAVTVKPVIPLDPETLAYHYQAISSGDIRYEIYRVSDDGQSSKRIVSGTASWRDKNIAYVELDTTSSPLNKAQDVFMVIWADLPDGRTIRSAKLFFNIIDDLKRGSLTSERTVF